MRALRMRALVCLAAAAAVIVAAGRSPAAPGGPLPAPRATMFKQLVQGDGRSYLPSCGYGFHYACYYEPFGYRNCGCWPGGEAPACPLGYRYACRNGPSGWYCACY